MTTGGWIVMLLSVGFVTLLFVWCIWKVIVTPESPHLHGFEMETPDERAQADEDKADQDKIKKSPAGSDNIK